MIISGGIFDDGWVTGSLVSAPWPATMSVDYVRAWQYEWKLHLQIMSNNYAEINVISWTWNLFVDLMV